MATREENIAKIRNAVYGREVREAIADGMEQTYDECEAFAEEAEGYAEEVADHIYLFTDPNSDGNIIVTRGETT